MLTIDRETFERLERLVLSFAGQNARLTAKERAASILSLLGLQAPEQQKTSVAARPMAELPGGFGPTKSLEERVERPERKVPRDTSEDYHVTGYSTHWARRLACSR